MRLGALLGILAAIAAGVLVQRGLASSSGGGTPAADTRPLSPRGSVVVFNADGHQAPLTVQVARGPATPTRVAEAFLQQSRPAAAPHLVPTSTARLDAGHTVVRFTETHGGVPVIGGEAVVVLDGANRIVAASSEVLPAAPPDTTPALSAAQARRTAVAVVARESGRAGLAAGPATLRIYDPRLVSAPGIARPALVWDVTVQRDAPSRVSRQVLVDARIGAVALETEGDRAALDRKVCDANATANQVPCTAPVRVEGGAATGVTDVNLAYQYAGDTYAFYSALGRNSLDGNGMSLISTVRYCPAANQCPYQNAYWDGAQMVYGAGFAAADDVVGHELSHGVTQYSSNLFYYAQSGAINESLSDVFGELIDLGNGAGTDTPAVRWLIGEDIPGIPGGIRNMKNPPAFGDPDSTASANYTADAAGTDSGGVHTNSNVNNKAAYLMTDGATFNGTTVTGIGTAKTAKVYYAASQLLRSGSDYRDLADALDQACATLQSGGQVTAADCTQVTGATNATTMRQVPVNAPVTTAPVCAAGQTPVDTFRDRFSTGPTSAWTRTVVSGSGLGRWYWASEPNAVGLDGHYSPTQPDNLWGYDQAAKSDTAIAMTSSVTVPAAGAHLRLHHVFGFDHDTNRAYDGGVLEYSTNGGGSWTDAGSLMTEGGYNGTIATGFGNPLQGRSAFVRSSYGYGDTRLDLSGLAGQQVRFRLRIGTDNSVDDYGWFLDDFRIYGCPSNDTTPPETTIAPTPPARVASAAPSFSFSSSEPGSTFACRMDLGAWGACTSPKTFTGLTDGAHTFAVRATDAALNTDLTPATADFTVDTTAPDTAIDLPPPALTTGAVSVSFSSPEATATFECRLDAGAWSACTSPWASGGLADGPHTLAVRALDDLGNRDATPASATWTLDTTPPNTTIASGPAGPTNDTTPTFSFSASEAGGTFECRVDAGAWATCTTPFTSSTLGDGPHSFAVHAIDAAGNTDASPAQTSFTVDTADPDTAIDVAPAATTPDSTPTVQFSSPDGGVTFACRVDAGSWGACTNPWTTAALADGAHTVSVRATDAAGNTDATPAQAAFAVDTTAPDTAIDLAPATTTGDNTPTVQFSSADAGATFACRVDLGGWAPCTSPFTASTLGDGAHTIAVRATDAVGNTDATPAQASFTVDTTPPNTTIGSGPGSATADSTPAFQFSATEAGATFACQVDGGAWAACTSPATVAPALADGPHTFAVRATDVAGNTDATPASSVFTVDTAAPDTAIDLAPAATTADSTPTLQFSSPDPGATFACRVDVGPWTACTSPATTAALADGAHTFSVRASDAVGNADATPAQASFTVDTTAPPTTIDTAPAAVTADATPSVAFSSADAGATFACRVDAGAWAPCTSPATVAPALADGAHSFAVRATDAVGNTDPTPAQASFAVDTTPPDTSLDLAPPPVTADNTPTFQLASTDPAATFECRVDGGAWSACSSPVTTDPLADGPHTFEARATDAVGNTDPSPAQSSFAVDTTVPDTTPPDTALDASPPALTTDPAPVFRFHASEAGATFECRIDAGAWASCTSPVTAPALADGDHTFDVRASDSLGNTDATPAEDRFTVDTTAPDTFIDLAPPATTADRTPTFQFSAGEAGATFACRIDAGAWAPCASPVTATTLADGAHTFAVRATDAIGNTDATPAQATFTVDAAGVVTGPTTPPDTIIAAPPGRGGERFSFAATPPKAVRSARTGAVRVTTFVRCSAPCRVRVRVRIPATVARSLGLRGTRAGREVIVALSARRTVGATGRVKLVVTLPRRLAAARRTLALTIAAAATDSAGHRASGVIGRVRLKPR